MRIRGSFSAAMLVGASCALGFTAVVCAAGPAASVSSPLAISVSGDIVASGDMSVSGDHPAGVPPAGINLTLPLLPRQAPPGP
jgi:hypothetical protein